MSYARKCHVGEEHRIVTPSGEVVRVIFERNENQNVFMLVIDAPDCSIETIPADQSRPKPPPAIRRGRPYNDPAMAGIKRTQTLSRFGGATR